MRTSNLSLAVPKRISNATFPKYTDDARVGRAVRHAIKQRGFTPVAFATSVGLTLSNFDAVACGFSPSQRARRKIEAALRQAFWSTAQDFAERLPLIDLFGCDIGALTVPELAALCRKRGVRLVSSSNLPRDYYLDVLLIHAAAQMPPPTLPTTPSR